MALEHTFRQRAGAQFLEQCKELGPLILVEGFATPGLSGRCQLKNPSAVLFELE